MGTRIGIGLAAGAAVLLAWEQRTPHFPAEPFYEGRFHITACGGNPRLEYGMGYAEAPADPAPPR